MKPDQYKEKYLEALCDKIDTDTNALLTSYENFERRLELAKKGA